MPSQSKCRRKGLEDDLRAMWTTSDVLDCALGEALHEQEERDLGSHSSAELARRIHLSRVQKIEEESISLTCPTADSDALHGFVDILPEIAPTHGSRPLNAPGASCSENRRLASAKRRWVWVSHRIMTLSAIAKRRENIPRTHKTKNLDSCVLRRTYCLQVAQPEAPSAGPPNTLWQPPPTYSLDASCINWEQAIFKHNSYYVG